MILAGAFVAGSGIIQELQIRHHISTGNHVDSGLPAGLRPGPVTPSAPRRSSSPTLARSRRRPATDRFSAGRLQARVPGSKAVGTVTVLPVAQGSESGVWTGAVVTE